MNPDLLDPVVPFEGKAFGKRVSQASIEWCVYFTSKLWLKTKHPLIYRAACVRAAAHLKQVADDLGALLFGEGAQAAATPAPAANKPRTLETPSDLAARVAAARARAGDDLI